MKKGVHLVFCVCIIVSLMAACQQKELPAAVDQSENLSIDDVAAGGEIESESEFVLGGEPEKLELPTYFDGTVSFEVAGENKVEFTYDLMATTDQQISLTTPEGIVWTLIIPPGALDESVVITLTELRNIVSSDIGSIPTGVLMEPDGLHFNLPVMIKMTGDNLEDTSLLLSGDHTGSQLGFAQIELIDNGISAVITHFSSMYGGQFTQETLEILRNIAGEKYKEVKTIALNFLKTKITAPEPPSIPLRCPGDETKAREQKEAFDNFLYQFENPEVALSQMLLETGRTEVLRGGENDSIELASKVKERLMIKANNLYKLYYPQEEYLIPIGRAALIAEYQFVLSGGESEGESFITKIGEWERKIADQYFESVRKNHDYELIPNLLLIDRDAANHGFSKEGSISEISKITRFKIIFDVEAETDLEFGMMTTTTHGDANYYVYSPPGNDPFSTGKGNYTGYEYPSQEDEEVVMTSPSNFEFRASIENFDPCETGTMEVVVSRFGRDSETFEVRAEDITIPVELAVIQGVMWEGFIDYVMDTPGGEEGYPWFRFTIPIENLNPVAGELELTKEITFNTGTLVLRIEHIPEK